MESKELISKLDDLGVSREEYSLFKKTTGKYCVVKEDVFKKISGKYYIDKEFISWSFYFLEESEYMSYRKSFDTQAEALNFMYEFFANNKYIDSEWIFQKSIGDGDKFELEEGVNIWDYKWVETDSLVNVKDNKHQQRYLSTIRYINIGEKRIEFLAIEVANCCWIIFQKGKIPEQPSFKKSLYKFFKKQKTYFRYCFKFYKTAAMLITETTRMTRQNANTKSTIRQ